MGVRKNDGTSTTMARVHKSCVKKLLEVSLAVKLDKKS